MTTSPDITQLIAALVAARPEFAPFEKSETAKISDTRSYRYGDLAALFEATVPALTRHGLCLTQAPTLDDGVLVLVTRLWHTSGQWLQGVYPLHAHQRPQEAGSEITYLRRYCAQSLLGVAAETDDDGVL